MILISTKYIYWYWYKMYWCHQNTLISTKDGPPNWAGQTDRRWPTPWRWSLMQPGAAFVIHIQSLNSAPSYSQWALNSALIHIWHWAVHLNTMGTEQCTFSQWALNNAPIHNLHWAVHLHTIDRQCICTVDNVGTMLTISLTHNTAECAGSTHTVHLFKARVGEDRVTSAG